MPILRTNHVCTYVPKYLGFVIMNLKSAQIPQIDLGFEVMETKEICDQIKD